MAGVTVWVRRALAELGPDATVKEIAAFILGQDSTIPRAHIPLALRKLCIRGLPAATERSLRERPTIGGRGMSANSLG